MVAGGRWRELMTRLKLPSRTALLNDKAAGTGRALGDALGGCCLTPPDATTHLAGV